jgi:NADH dehydrogenase
MHVNSFCVLGGSGFVGGHLVARLCEDGKQVTVLSRHPERHRELLVLPTVKVEQADVHDREQLARHFHGADAVINLVGILNEDGHDGEGFRHAHVDLAHKVVDACRQQGVKRLLHMSALNADKQGPSHYLRTKGEAENHVHNFAGSELAVTSFRPSVIFGPGDSFFNRFAGLLKYAPVMPLACPNARFQPVYVGDVVDAFVGALEDAGSAGQRIDLCGPEVFTLREIVEYTAEVMGVHRWIVPVPDGMAEIQAGVMEYVPGKPFSRDNYQSLQVDSVCSEGCEVCATGVRTVVPGYLGD